MANASPCQTPGAQYGTEVSERQVSVTVDLPPSVRVAAEDVEALRTNMHNALELVLAPYFVGVDVLSLPQPASATQPDSESQPDSDPRRRFGQIVRQTWIGWVNEQLTPPDPSWWAPWPELGSREREADMRIGATVAGEALRMAAARLRDDEHDVSARMVEVYADEIDPIQGVDRG